MKKFYSFIISIAFMLLLVKFGVIIPAAIIFSVLMFFFLLFILYNKNDVLKEKLIPGTGGVSEYKLKKVLNYGREKVLELKKISLHIHDDSVKKDIQEICLICEDIFRSLKENPRKIRNLRRFINYYLGSIINISKDYKRILDFKEKTPEMKLSLQKAEKGIAHFKNAFQKILIKMNDDELLNLDVEIETAMKSFNNEGLVKGVK